MSNTRQSSSLQMRCGVSLLIFGGLVTVALCDSLVRSPSLGKQELRFDSQGKFKILQFTDLHYETPEDGAKTAAIEQTLITSERPNMLAVTGDVHSGWLFYNKIPEYKVGWHTLFDPVENLSVPWAFAHGNHDSQCGLGRGEIIDFLKAEFPHTLTEKGPLVVTGSGNYYIPVYSASNPSKMVMVLWFMDSGSESCQGDKHSYGCIEASQTDWFLAASKALTLLNGGRPLPGLMFFHIPTAQWNDVWNQAACRGEKNESVACPTHETGFVKALAKEGSVKAVFVGHDHDNDYCGQTTDGITLCYGRKTGVGCYGPVGLRGGRVIELSEADPNHFNTWIRNEIGDIEVLPDHQPDRQPSPACGAI
ncbi:putative ser/thr phosphatase superfamily protein [Paratrimastix pyriformis]|uniref:Ser/thr phosphatase superfamily protein n=1 Tax=Paratrimastix pyriformis TaxID=342808 RepID=A0ABQ8UHG6_9EUKA|nr:putative ser/thr phosphatase superfamily protein [Paratrimastix pyriformis]